MRQSSKQLGALPLSTHLEALIEDLVFWSSRRGMEGVEQGPAAVARGSGGAGGLDGSGAGLDH